MRTRPITSPPPQATPFSIPSLNATLFVIPPLNCSLGTIHIYDIVPVDTRTLIPYLTIAGGDAAASIILQLRAPGLVQKLRLDNFGAFAEIFCLAVMQVTPHAPHTFHSIPAMYPYHWQSQHSSQGKTELPWWIHTLISGFIIHTSLIKLMCPPPRALICYRQPQPAKP